MSSLKIKKGDTVKVILGEDKGKTGRVLEVDPTAGSMIVSGVHVVSRHTKPKNAQSPGGIVKSERPIRASKLMVVCPSCGNETRVGFAFDAEGNKYRVCKNKLEKDKYCRANLDKTAAKEEKEAKKKTKKAADKPETESKPEKKAVKKPKKE